MPLSRLENFLVNTDGNILYVNPSDLDATDSFDNKGNSLTRPFVTLQRALIEAARFAYQQGFRNDRFDRTTILLYPGIHLIDNRPGFYIQEGDSSNAVYKELDENGKMTGIEFHQRNIAQRLVEECMLACNNATALFLAKHSNSALFVGANGFRPEQLAYIAY